MAIGDIHCNGQCSFQFGLSLDRFKSVGLALLCLDSGTRVLGGKLLAEPSVQLLRLHAYVSDPDSGFYNRDTRFARFGVFGFEHVLFFAVIAFYFFARTMIAADRAVTTTFLFGLFPLFATYGFFSYSDAMYLCFAILSLYFFIKRNYVACGLAGALVTTTRDIGALLTPIYIVLILYDHWKNKLKLKRTMLALAAPVAAFVLVSFYFFALSGNALAIIDAESTGWGVTVSGPLNLMTLLFHPSMLILPMEFEVSIARLFYLSFFLIGAVMVRKISRQLAFYSLSFMLFIVNLSGTSVFSEPRYALAAWPVFLLFSNIKEHETIILIAVAGILLTLQSVFYYLTWFWM